MDNVSKLKKSVLQIEDFELWIHERQFPDLEDYWDGNWVIVTAQYKTNSTSVTVHGPILHLSELKSWLDECKEIYATLSGEAKLSCRDIAKAKESLKDYQSREIGHGKK